eukprot:TRINITY_DN94761_c0_g1_i1.p1 TRINITY_DN94761_c0_g1~~TRINITY_DN94761_c0_g1_i1.p1  ORF type:complete len:254 (+),score=33.07 TRINITY_DN94761_c0_g1_i1:67-762(+)
MSLDLAGLHKPCPSCKRTDRLESPRGSRAVHCHRCGTARCLICHNMWSRDHKCRRSTHMARAWREFRNSHQDTSDFDTELKPMGYKRCPACGVPCEKDDPDACDHMTCVCGHEFCWVCGEDRAVIKAHDNSYHQPDCPHYWPCEEAPRWEKECPVCQKNGAPCIRPCTKQASVTQQVKLEQLEQESEHDDQMVYELTDHSEIACHQLHSFGFHDFVLLLWGNPLASCCKAS